MSYVKRFLLLEIGSISKVLSTLINLGDKGVQVLQGGSKIILINLTSIFNIFQKNKWFKKIFFFQIVQFVDIVFNNKFHCSK